MIAELLQRATMLAKAQPAAEEHIGRQERQLGLTLPADYGEFLTRSNGAELEIDDWHISLWPVEDLERITAEYELDLYVPGLLAIGTDGGSLAYAFDYRDRSDAPVVVSVPLGDLFVEAVQFLARSLTELFKQAIGESP